METFSTARIRESYANDPESYKIIYAWRELAEKPGTKCWKASLRVYVVGLFAPCAHTKLIAECLEVEMKTHPELPEWLGAYYKENPEDHLFDLSIYDRNSKLNCVECSKGYKLMSEGKPPVQDWRLLISRPQYTDEPKESFLIQHLKENDQRAVASDGTIEKKLLEARNQAIKRRSGNKRHKLSDANAECEEGLATKIKTAIPELASVKFGVSKQYGGGIICVPVLSDNYVICKRLHHGSKTCIIVTEEKPVLS